MKKLGLLWVVASLFGATALAAEGNTPVREVEEELKDVNRGQKNVVTNTLRFQDRDLNALIKKIRSSK